MIMWHYDALTVQQLETELQNYTILIYKNETIRLMRYKVSSPYKERFYD